MNTSAKRSMALDVGDARIGLALSDPLGLTAQPYETIERSKGEPIGKILEIASEKQVGKIVVGLPYELDGTFGEQAKKVQSFVDRLNKALLSSPEHCEISTVLWDERMTTVQAERVIQGSKLKDSKRSAALDRVSAAIILESYLGANTSRI